MILMERKLETDEVVATVRIEKLNAVEVQVNITDSVGVVEWCRNTSDGELAIDMYWHPFFYGYMADYRLDRRQLQTQGA